MSMNTWREGTVQREQSEAFFSGTHWQEKKTMSTNWNTESSLSTLGNAFLMWQEQHCHRLLIEFVEFHPWRSSKPAWTWSWTTCSQWTCLNGDLDQMSPGVPANLSCSVISLLKVNFLSLRISSGNCIFLHLQKVLLMLAKKAKEEVNTMLWIRTSFLRMCYTFLGTPSSWK